MSKRKEPEPADGLTSSSSGSEGGESEVSVADDPVVSAPNAEAEQSLVEEPQELQEVLDLEDEQELIHLSHEVQAALKADEAVQGSSWGPGPDTFDKLYAWPVRYADVLLSNADAIKVAQDLLQLDISHHEAFAGTGGAGIALHMVRTALAQRLDSLGDLAS